MEQTRLPLVLVTKKRESRFIFFSTHQRTIQRGLRSPERRFQHRQCQGGAAPVVPPVRHVPHEVGGDDSWVEAVHVDLQGLHPPGELFGVEDIGQLGGSVGTPGKYNDVSTFRFMINETFEHKPGVEVWPLVIDVVPVDGSVLVGEGGDDDDPWPGVGLVDGGALQEGG